MKDKYPLIELLSEDVDGVVVGRLTMEIEDNSYRQITAFLCIKLDKKGKYRIILRLFGCGKEDITDLLIGNFLSEINNLFDFEVKYVQLDDGLIYKYIRENTFTKDIPSLRNPIIEEDLINRE